MRKEAMGSFSVFCETQLLCQNEVVRVATIRKPGAGYQIGYFDPNWKRRDAEGELDKRVSLIAEGRYLDVTSAQNSK
jgi:hypothetical protein